MNKESSEKIENNEYLKSWEIITKEKPFVKLDENESAQFEKARFTEEQVRKTSFVLGGQVNSFIVSR